MHDVCNVHSKLHDHADILAHHIQAIAWYSYIHVLNRLFMASLFFLSGRLGKAASGAVDVPFAVSVDRIPLFYQYSCYCLFARSRLRHST